VFVWQAYYVTQAIFSIYSFHNYSFRSLSLFLSLSLHLLCTVLYIGTYFLWQSYHAGPIAPLLICSAMRFTALVGQFINTIVNIVSINIKEIMDEILFQSPHCKPSYFHCHKVSPHSHFDHPLYNIKYKIQYNILCNIFYSLSLMLWTDAVLNLSINWQFPFSRVQQFTRLVGRL
jgi:hypothetical protein